MLCGVCPEGNENVTAGHDPPGALTPRKYVNECETPFFLHLLNNGLEAGLDDTLRLDWAFLA